MTQPPESMTTLQLLTLFGFQSRAAAYEHTGELGCRQCGATIARGQRRWVGPFSLGLHTWSICFVCVPEKV